MDFPALSLRMLWQRAVLYTCRYGSHCPAQLKQLWTTLSTMPDNASVLVNFVLSRALEEANVSPNFRSQVWPFLVLSPVLQLLLVRGIHPFHIDCAVSVVSCMCLMHFSGRLRIAAATGHIRNCLETFLYVCVLSGYFWGHLFYLKQYQVEASHDNQAAGDVQDCLDVSKRIVLWAGIQVCLI